MSVVERVVWERFPPEEALAELVINPVTQRDQHGHTYEPFPWSSGHRNAAICAVCEEDFTEGGWVGYAADGGKLVRLIVCAGHEEEEDG